MTSPQGELNVVSQPAGTRGYHDLRRAATREYLGRGLRPSIASTVDLARMLGALGANTMSLSSTRSARSQSSSAVWHELTL